MNSEERFAGFVARVRQHYIVLCIARAHGLHEVFELERMADGSLRFKVCGNAHQHMVRWTDSWLIGLEFDSGSPRSEVGIDPATKRIRVEFADRKLATRLPDVPTELEAVATAEYEATERMVTDAVWVTPTAVTENWRSIISSVALAGYFPGGGVDEGWRHLHGVDQSQVELAARLELASRAGSYSLGEDDVACLLAIPSVSEGVPPTRDGMSSAAMCLAAVGIQWASFEADAAKLGAS